MWVKWYTIACVYELEKQQKKHTTTLKYMKKNQNWTGKQKNKTNPWSGVNMALHTDIFVTRCFCHDVTFSPLLASFLSTCVCLLDITSCFLFCLVTLPIVALLFKYPSVSAVLCQFLVNPCPFKFSAGLFSWVLDYLIKNMGSYQSKPISASWVLPSKHNSFQNEN